MQLRFNLVLIGVSLLTLAVAIWFALWLANRLVAPIARLALAAERVGAGDLDARVPVRGSPDEIGTLARAFNRMTSQLKTQQNALIGANHQLDRRREFTEAVLSGVSAGVLSITAAGVIRVANRSAAALLETLGRRSCRPVAAPSPCPNWPTLLDEAAAWRRHCAARCASCAATDTQTLSVRIAGESGSESGGFVLTFDDISAQLADQRRAAWADVARRIAHEIKNPLTPIQLAAERLQRKYGRQIAEDPETFGVLTATIVRQVGDLRRMVDEFSDFARLPKPVFAPESLDAIVRAGAGAAGSRLSRHRLCRHRQRRRGAGLRSPATGAGVDQYVKNAAEAVTTRIERDSADGLAPAPGRIVIAIADDEQAVTVTITDNGIGLPVESRDRLDRTLCHHPRARHRARPRHRQEDHRGPWRQPRTR